MVERAQGLVSTEDFRPEDALRYLEREGALATATAGGKKLYMLAEAGLRELLGEGGDRCVAEVVLSEFLKSADPGSDPGRLP